MQKATKLAHSPDDVCAMLGISHTKLYAEWKEGRGPASIKIGRRRLITEDGLRDYLESLKPQQAAA